MNGKKKILIADDDQDVVKVLRILLEKSGFDTACALEGVRAIALAHKEKPDLICLDLKMPAGDGPSVMQTLHSQLETERIPIVVLTGMTLNDDEREDLLRQGAQAIVRKPYDQKELLTTIEGIVSR